MQLHDSSPVSKHVLSLVCSPTHFTVLTQLTYFSISNDKILFSISINVYI
jgi:hypothetical protein